MWRANHFRKKKKAHSSFVYWTRSKCKPICTRILLISIEQKFAFLSTLRYQKGSISPFIIPKPSCLYSKVYVDWMKGKLSKKILFSHYLYCLIEDNTSYMIHSVCLVIWDSVHKGCSDISQGYPQSPALEGSFLIQHKGRKQPVLRHLILFHSIFQSFFLKQEYDTL